VQMVPLNPNRNDGWIRSLPEIAIAMNISKRQATNKAAYLVVSREWEANGCQKMSDYWLILSTPSGSTEHDTGYFLADIEVEQGLNHTATRSDFEQQVQITSESREY